MAKAYPIELRERVVAHVEEGHSHRATSRHFKTSVKFVNDMVKLKRETGSLVAKTVGKRPGDSKLAPHAQWLRAIIDKQGDITLNELSIELSKQWGIDLHSTTIGRFVHRLGLSHKKRQFTPKNSIVQM